MARQIIENVLCDVCLNDDETFTPAVETPWVAIGSAKPKVVALCERHMKELFEPFQSVLAEHGQTEGGGKVLRSGAADSRGEATHFCPDPTCDRHTKGYTYRSSLSSHVERHHEMTLTELRAKVGLEEEPSSELDESCPECGELFPASAYQYPKRILGIHRAQKHGVRSKKNEKARATRAA